MRVAVQPGAAVVRVAAADGEGEPWLLAELPSAALGIGPPLSDLVRDLVGGPPEELLLVHPASWPASRIAAWVRDAAGLAGSIRTVPAPLAAAGPGPRAVLDVGHAGAEATRLGADGSVLAVRTCSVGGSRLDDVVAAVLDPAPAPAGNRREEARRVREALSLLPTAPGRAGITASEVGAALEVPLGAAVDALRAVLVPGGPVPVLLVGGVARAPLLAELVDRAGIADVRIPARPDAAAVLGSLALPAEFATARSSRTDMRAVRRCPPVLPPPPPRRRRPLRAALVGVGAVAAAGALLASGTRSPAALAVPDGVLVQYGYRLDLPAGWEHTGGRPEHRRIVLTPDAGPDGSDLIAVERSPLGYDAGVEAERALAELRAEFDAAVAGGSELTGYVPAARVAGREVVAYRQREGRAEVDWFVVLDGDAQLSVGCRHTPAGAASVRAACDVVVGSVRRA